MPNWVVIGIGDISSKRVIPAIHSETRSRLYGIVTRDSAKAAPYDTRTFATLDEHAARLCREMSLMPFQVDAVRNELANLAAAGLLVSRGRLLEVVRKSPRSSEPPPRISTVGIPTRDRPATFPEFANAIPLLSGEGFEATNVSLQMPRFTLRQTLDVLPALAAAGLADARREKAAFAPMTPWGLPESRTAAAW